MYRLIGYMIYYDIDVLYLTFVGNSVGTPNETGLNIDADTVLLYAVKHPKLRNSKMVVFGQSLGGAVAISLAHRYPELVSGVILENTFKSISSMVDIMMPYLKTLKAYVLNIKWNSDEKIDQLTMPLLFISGNSMMLTTVIENLRIQCH